MRKPIYFNVQEIRAKYSDLPVVWHHPGPFEYGFKRIVPVTRKSGSKNTRK